MRKPMENAASSCVVCDEMITNPICPDCLAKQMRSWVNETNPTLAERIDGFNMSGDVSCLFCGQGMSICAHCYSRDVYEQIALHDKKLAREFMARFDFELRKELLA
ncbi:MAG TPA: hypothetical protein VJB66_05565 [Candidatus Nanoarchaeia archaeon]|nr:hypothetical protein [Candidatus Nanoarchaeia archaeon]